MTFTRLSAAAALWTALATFALAQSPAPDVVRVELCEDGVPHKEEWPAQPPAVAERYTLPALGFSRVPHKYVDTGVRGDRANPFLLRATAVVGLPAGNHRLLLRGRGACRLFIDGRQVLHTPFPPPVTDGHTPIPTKYLDLGPDFRFAPPGNRETWTHFTSRGGKHTLVLESIIGGRRGKGVLRPEPGETVVAISTEGSTSFRLIAPTQVIPYTDDGWAAYARDEADRVVRLEKQRRAEAFKPHAPVWERRHALAKEWLASTPGPAVPELPAGFPAHNAVDHFIAEKIADVTKQAARRKGAVDFHRQVRPVLEAKCFGCHLGAKVKGGLRLDEHGAREGGDSGEPAIVPGRPEKSVLIARIASSDNAERMPPGDDALSPDEVKLLKQWVAEGASWAVLPSRALNVTPPADELAFLRRVTLDTAGVIPTPEEVGAFLADTRPDRRTRVIDRLLADDRWADHWVSYWQDVLAENPNILNPTLNNTGPFRWWIHEALLDNKPMDLFATELVLMRGSHYHGGPAGFAMASENDVPMAEKAAIVGATFLGVQMRCARCHDAPAHRSTQKDLFQLASLLAEAPLKVPATSSVPKDKLHGQGGRAPLIRVTLQPGSKVEPAWPFADFTRAVPDSWVPQDAKPRERLAALLTAPQNERFAEVLANRVWKRFMGRGLVEPADDWEKGTPTHSELLRYLAHELVGSGYDLKHLARVILTSHAYQRATDPALTEPDPWYAAPPRRRLGAEQVVDSLFVAAGKPMQTEEVSLDIDGGRDIKNSITLGKPRRAWQLASTSNERDRPSLALPKVQAVIDVLEAFGWRPARQSPLTDRETAANVLQPAVLANGTMSTWLTRLSDDHGVTRLALEDQSVERLVDRLFLRVLTRAPRPEERASVVAYLRAGYDDRVATPPAMAPKSEKRVPPKYVSWSNHLTEEANAIKIRLEAEARRGAPPTCRLTAPWRQRLEDVLWALLNDPEFVFTP